MRSTAAFFALSLSLCAALGCSSSSGGPAAGAGGSAPANGSYSTMISAATGGTVMAPGASVVIPGGALSGDTTVTVVVSDKTGQPNEADIPAKIFTFGPDGTKFNLPVTMTLELDGSAAPMGKTAQIVFLQDGKWVPLADSKVSGNQVVATTTHFTPFTVMWVSGQGQTGGQCMAFTPCGGDISGTWTYTAGCATFPPGADPLNGKCPGAKLGLTLDISGTFTATSSMFTVAQTATFTESIDAPKTCFSGAPCSSLMKDFPNISDNGTSCVGTSVPMMNTSNDTGTLTTSGTTVSFTSSKSGSTATNGDYCVTGNSLTVRINPEKPGSATVIYTATK